MRGLRAGEGGFMLVGVVVMVALVLIALSVAAPVIAKELRRDKEVESQHRAEQYVRAIRLYYRKFHAYPPSIDALKQSSNIRFLRQEYVDPLTGKADWRLIHLGEQKTTVKGFFGQELGGLAAGGLGSAAGMNSGVGTPVGAGSSAGTTTTIGSTPALAGGFSGASITTGASAGAGAFGASGATGASGSTGGIGGGGGAIVGVGTAASGNSIATPNQQTTYGTWEFWYDPRIEQMYQKGHMNAGVGSGGMGSQPASSFGSGLNGQPNGAGSTGLGNGFGSGMGSGFGSGTGSGLGSGTTTPSPVSKSPSAPQ